MIEPDLIQNRIDNFWGYGSLMAPVWLVGMEERFDVKKFGIEMLREQFQYAKNNMRDGMLDASRSKISEWQHLANMEPFLSGGKLQHTWEFPIMLYLFLKNKKSQKELPTEKEILDFQRFVLADCDKIEEKYRVATLELSPLPSPDINSWLFTDVAGFETRKSYERTYQKQRSKGLRDLVQKYSPTLKLVIFYSANKKTHLPIWAEAIGKASDELTKITHQMYFEKINKTSFCIIPQNHRGSMTPARLYEYAEEIKERVGVLSR